MNGTDQIAAVASPQLSPQKLDRPIDRPGAIPSAEELREAVLAELMGEQLEIVRQQTELARAQRDVATLMDGVDRRLTATLQALRSETAQLAEIVGRSSDAFRGEVALRAAEHARREFAVSTAGAMDVLAARMERVRAAPSRKERLVDCLATAAMAAVLVALALWVIKR